MNKLVGISICLMSLTLMITACGKNKSDNSIEYNNNVFTESLYDSLEEISYWNDNEEIVIKDKKDMKSIFNNLSSLVLKEASDKADIKYGHQIIKIVTEDKTVEIGLLSDEIVVDNQRYAVDKDIVNSIRKIALKSQK